MKLLTAVICLLFCLASPTSSQRIIRRLPADALVVEKRSLPSRNRSNRALVLWMKNYKKVPSDYGSDDLIPCPDQTRGSHYSGPTCVSLMNTGTNTINVVGPDAEDGDSFDVPYAIRKGYYYQVEGRVRRNVEAKPTLMWLRDYNGDGKALEFALFDAPACMGLQTTLIGYSEKQDRVVHYPISLDVIEGTKQAHRNALWADYIFNKKPLRRGYGRHYLGLVLFLFAVNGVLQSPALIFDRDFSVASFSDFNLGAAHGVGRALGLDLIDHFVVGEGQVLRQGAAFAERQHPVEIFSSLQRPMGRLPQRGVTPKRWL